MNKSKFILCFFSLVALSACTRGNGKTGTYYKVTFNLQDGDVVTKLYPQGYYPTPDGYTKYLSNVRDTERYEPSLRPVYSDDTVYYVRNKVTITGTPRYGDLTKYFKWKETINFYDYGIERSRYSDVEISATRDMTLPYRYNINFYDVIDSSGNYVPSTYWRAEYGDSIQYPNASIYGDYYVDGFGTHYFDYWEDMSTGSRYYNFYEYFYVTHDMDLFAYYYQP